MSALMLMQFGNRAMSAFSAYSAQRHQYKLNKYQFELEQIGREYRENMSNISHAMARNNMTGNEIATRDAAATAGLALQVQGMKQESQAEAAAAAAGVGGGSVTSTMRGLMRSKYQAMHAHEKQKSAQKRVHRNERRQAALQAAMNKDITPAVPVFTAPSPASALLGLGASMIDIWDSHQTPGNSSVDALSRLGRR